MSPYSVCQMVQHGVAESNVTFCGVDQLFETALPTSGRTLREQTRSTLDAVTNALQKADAAGSILHLTVFLAEPTHVAACRRVVREFFGDLMPATSYIPQPPCEGTLVSVEAIALGRGREKVKITRVSDQVVTVHQDGSTWVYADQAVPLTSAPGVYEKTVSTYEHLRRFLPQAGARMDQVLRTWLHLGGIVDDEGPTQRYKELNRARTEIYDGVRTSPRFFLAAGRGHRPRPS